MGYVQCTCIANLILLDLVILIIFGDESSMKFLTVQFSHICISFAIEQGSSLKNITNRAVVLYLFILMLAHHQH